jgi:imidazolonepropionase-like amidohydrolase
VGGLLSVPLVVKEGSRQVHVPRQAAAVGLRFAFRSGAATGARQLVPQITLAVHDGWSVREALAAMTIIPARIFGLDEQVGSIEEGKDADLVFLSGKPFALTTRVQRVMVEGTMVSDF